NGQRYIYVVAEMKMAGSNAFRLRSVARNSSGNESSSMTTRAGLGGQLTLPLSMGRMPLAPGGSETFRTRFQVPCNGSTSFRLGWHDADRPPGGIPDDPDITWRLINTSNSNQELTSAALAYVSSTNENAFLGSNNQDKEITIGNSTLIRVLPGDNYI